MTEEHFFKKLFRINASSRHRRRRERGRERKRDRQRAGDQTLRQTFPGLKGQDEVIDVL